MSTYKTLELINKLSEIIEDGYEYVEITESEEDEDSFSTLHFDAVDGYCSSIDYESVQSVTIPDDYDYTLHIRGKIDDKCHNISFSYKELFLIEHALNNALEYFKEYAADPNCPKEDRDEIKRDSIDMRNLQAKLAKFFKVFKTH